KLADEANRLRKKDKYGKEIVIAIVGEQLAAEISMGYNPPKSGKNLVPDKAALAALSKEQRKAAMAMGSSINLSARASELASPERPGHLLRAFGQSDREVISNANDGADVPQALALLNGPALDALKNPMSKLSQDVKTGASPVE